MMKDIIANFKEEPITFLGPDINPIWYQITNLSHSIGEILFIINIILSIATVKKVKKNILPCIISIIAEIVAYVEIRVIFKLKHTMYQFVSEMPTTQELVIRFSLVIIPSIIQIAIFVRLITNIKNNKKKEEKNV